MVATPKQLRPIPPLENGDRLTRAEFEQRYQAMPEHQKAELIEGRVFMASPVRARKHGKPHAAVMTWLGTYWQATPGIELMDNPTVRLDADNEPQPDACLRIEEAAGGQSRITVDDYLEGAPELIVEIAASSASYDLHDKKQVYRRNGVQEYLVWRVLEETFDWFVLQDGAYVNLPVDPDGMMRSRVFPGLWLAVADLLAGRLAQVVAELKLGLESPEYSAIAVSRSLKSRGLLALPKQQLIIEKISAGKRICLAKSPRPNHPNLNNPANRRASAMSHSRAVWCS